jgi:hypothetical protein
MPAVGTDLLLIEREGVPYKATAAEIAALGGGGSGLAGQVVLTVPNNAIEAEATFPATGVSPASVVLIGIAPHTDDDENTPDMIDLTSVAAFPGTDEITVTATFLTPHAGNIRLNWSAF